MQRPNSTFHGMNPRERESKLANLRNPPLGPRSTVDPSVFERPVGQAFRKEERSVLNEPVVTETPVISAGIRIRVESNTRDAMNTRILEQMPFTAARNITPNDILKANKPLVQEMNPIDSRRGVNSYKQAMEFFPDADTQTGIQPKMKAPSGFMQNPYLQRMDAQNDPRQIVRELRSAVTEDNREKYLDLSQKIANRNFSSVLLQVAEEEKITNLTAYELLKPKIDDFSQQYRKY
jgi:shikimate kinase